MTGASSRVLGFADALVSTTPRRAPVAALSSEESTQIKICRVLCIYFMMSVHVSLNGWRDTYLGDSDFAYLAFIWVDVLGRASVAALSVISGYILALKAAETPLFATAAKKAKTILVPMLVWNLVFMALLVAKDVLSHSDHALLEAIRNGDALAVLSLTTGLLGPTANLSLFFLRDLFVSSVIAAALMTYIERYPLFIVAAAMVGAVFDMFEPVVFRGNVLLFVIMGAALSRRGARISEISRPAIALPVMAGFSAALALVYFELDALIHANEVVNLFKRIILTAGMLFVTAYLARTALAAAFAWLERRIFVTYLSHVTVVGVLWFLWTRAFGDEMAPAYAVFFLLSPFAAIVAGVIIDDVIARLPRGAQMLMRGRATTPDGRGRKQP